MVFGSNQPNAVDYAIVWERTAINFVLFGFCRNKVFNVGGGKKTRFSNPSMSLEQPDSDLAGIVERVSEHRCWSSVCLRDHKLSSPPARPSQPRCVVCSVVWTTPADSPKLPLLAHPLHSLVVVTCVLPRAPANSSISLDFLNFSFCFLFCSMIFVLFCHVDQFTIFRTIHRISNGL